MKTIKNTKTGEYKRLEDKDAKQVLPEGWAYCGKEEWKKCKDPDKKKGKSKKKEKKAKKVEAEVETPDEK